MLYILIFDVYIRTTVFRISMNRNGIMILSMVGNTPSIRTPSKVPPSASSSDSSLSHSLSLSLTLSSIQFSFSSSSIASPPPSASSSSS